MIPFSKAKIVHPGTDLTVITYGAVVPRALQAAQKRLEDLAADNRISSDVLATLRARHDYRFGGLPKDARSERDPAAAAANVRSDLIALEREYIYQLLRDGQITDEARRRIERELDLEEAGIASKKESGFEPPL